MLTVRALNINDAFAKGAMLIAQTGVRRESRNGSVLVAPEPVATRFAHPTHRVLFHPERDANPFFHLFEALWMLTGRNDVETLQYIVPRMASFSDDGQIFHGAYGHRWRKHFGFDQLDVLVRELYQSPNSRRAMLQIWDAKEDLGTDSKDLPCNTMVKFHIADDKLHMVVFNRSNDMLWGAYGANAVQFSVLQEYLADRLAVLVGYYEQVSSDFHVYVEPWERLYPGLLSDTVPINPYTAIGQDHVMTMRLVDNVSHTIFDGDLTQFVENLQWPGRMLGQRWSAFFEYIAVPMALAYRNYRNEELAGAEIILRKALESTGPMDWLVNAHQWMLRRIDRRART